MVFSRDHSGNALFLFLLSMYVISREIVESWTDLLKLVILQKSKVTEVHSMSIVIIVEGKNDKSRLKRIVQPQITILCTYGTPSSATLDDLKKKVGDKYVYLFTDNDASGKRIRGLLRDTFPDAEQIYTRKGYAGVEGTPEEYLIQQLEKAGLEEYIIYPDPDPAFE